MARGKMRTQKEVMSILRRMAALHLSKEMLQRCEVEVLDEPLRDSLRVQVRWQVAAKKATDPLLVPVSWWQHLKQDHFPAWALKRWPVQHRRHWAYHILPSVQLPERNLLDGFHDWIPEEGKEL